MAQFKLEDIKSLIRRLECLIEVAELDQDAWSRSVAMGEIRLMAVRLFELSQEQLKGDDPHCLGASTLFAYMVDAFDRWDKETAEERAKLKVEVDRRNREWSMSSEEWKRHKESK